MFFTTTAQTIHSTRHSTTNSVQTMKLYHSATPVWTTFSVSNPDSQIAIWTSTSPRTKASDYTISTSRTRANTPTPCITKSTESPKHG